MLKLDRSSTQAVSVEIYEIRTSRLIFGPCWNICIGFLFVTTLDIYKDYFKGLHACKKCPSSLFSLKKLLRLYAKSFVTKEFRDLHCWWTDELCSQQHLQVAGVSHILGSMHHWLVTYWGSYIERKDCHNNTSSIG